MGLDWDTWRLLLENERLPAAVVDLEAFDRNAASLEAIVAGTDTPIRLATKSVRVPALIRRVLARGPAWRGLMCYCSGEATLLANEGFDDLLVAYPTVQAAELLELRALHDAGIRVALVVDSPEGLEALARSMSGVRKPFRVVAELDVSWRPAWGAVHIGARRSPIRSAEALGRWLVAARTHAAHLTPIGVMAYEAHIAGLTDRNHFRRATNPLHRVVRRLSITPAARLRAQVSDVFDAAGLQLELFNGGGTGSLEWSSREPHLTELTAGSGLLCPHLFDLYSNIDLEPACGFALQVVRSSDAGFVTCQGGGYVASGQPGWDRVPLPWKPEGLRLVSAEGAGEVQTPLRVPRGVALTPGDPVLLRHAKGGELAERFAEYLLVENGRIVERAPTYRGMGATFP